METEEKNPFEQDWEKEIVNKSFEELAKILANREDYAPGFIEIVQKRLKSHSDYSEDKVNAIIATSKDERRRNEELDKQRMSGWLQLYMAGLVLGSIGLCQRTLSTALPEYYGYNLPLMWTDIMTIVGIAVMAGYSFVSLLKRWSNAIYLTYTYLGICFFLGLLSLLNLDEGTNYFRVFWGFAVTIIWGLYFNYSERIKARYPEEDRCFLKRDKYIIGTIIAIPILLFLWGMNSTPSSPSLSVADGMEASEQDQTSLIIDENKLEENEITDGLTIVKLPHGMKYEVVDIEDGHKMLVLTDEKGEAFYEIRIISGFTNTFSNSEFEEYWLQSRDSTMLECPHEITTSAVSEVKAGKCYRKIEKYQSELPVIWDFTAIYSHKIHKYCVLSAWYNIKDDVPIEEVINGIKFEQ